MVDARFAKPLDTKLIEQLARHHEVFLTIEDGAAGGFGAAVMHHLAWAGLLDRATRFRPLTFPDRFVEHAAPAAQTIDALLGVKDIVGAAMQALGRHEAGAARA